ncbi:MAG: hypothetical protein NTZ59_14670, partial [Bacteroidetes bacterium]|nr:hypothetical protein [Bacteroidota bacterium]
MKKWLFIFLFVSIKCIGNDSLLIKRLFQNLLNKQQLTTNFFVEGSFISYRQHSNSDNLKQDNNIFFTALIAYTLQDLKPYLTNEEKVIADTIINRASKAFSHYQNKNKRLSYNFWRTDTVDNFFPNDHILKLFRKSLKLPDDLDDTSIILAALNVDDSTAEAAHKTMQYFVNGNNNTIKNTYKKYKNIPAYSTWYGVKMPIDFDFGVHCNILSFVNKYNLPWQKADSVTYDLILKMIDEKLYLTSPKYISPYYSYTPVLLYHIARLTQSKKLPELENRKQQIIDDALNEFNKTGNTLYKTLLATTLLKFGVHTNEFILDSSIANGSLNTDEFIYYTGHLFGHLNNTIKKVASNMKATEYKWFCSAFNECLLLEYLLLKNRKSLIVFMGKM